VGLGRGAKEPRSQGAKEMGDKKSEVGSRFEAPQKKADTTAHYISPPALLAPWLLGFS